MTIHPTHLSGKLTGHASIVLHYIITELAIGHFDSENSLLFAGFMTFPVYANTYVRLKL